MAQKGTSRGGTRLFYILLAIVAVAGIASIVYTLAGSRDSAVTKPVKLSGVSSVRDLYEMATAVKQGPDNAPVKVVEFADYSCPACRQFDMDMLPVLKQKFLSSGNVQFIYYDFPLIEIHAHSFFAARAARCAGAQGKFWQYQNILFRNQDNWAEQQKTPMGAFENFAKTVGLDQKAFSGCLNSNKYADVVTANRKLAEQLGLDSTPTILVNNRRWMGGTIESLEHLIQSDIPGPAAG